MIINPYRFVGGGGGGGDPNYASVVSLVEMSTNMTDAKGHTWTLNNGANVNAGSLEFDGVNDTATVPDSADWDFGTGDFTVEYFLNPDSFAASGGGNQVPVMRGLSVWAVLHGLGGAILWYRGATLATTSNTMTTGAFQHVAISRVSGTTRIYIGGAQGASFSDANAYDAAVGLTLGTNGVGSGFYDGRLKGLRITKGVGRYSTAFTPPSLPYPTS